jgi:putative transposase
MGANATEKGPHRKRCRRLNTPGQFHFLTFSCFRRQPFLSRERCRRWLADAIMVSRDRHAFRIVAYVFMPEHVHLLIRPMRKNYSISAMLAGIKLSVARRARSFVLRESPEFLVHMSDVQPNGKRAVRFWQRGGGYDRNIFSGEELWEKIHYLHNNPVKRGLVMRAVDWEWSSAADYAKLRLGPLPVENGELPWS